MGSKDQKLRRPLHKAVAHYLFLMSEESPPGEAGLYRAAALALLGEEVAPGLMAEAAMARSNDGPLHRREDLRAGPDLEDVWDGIDDGA